MNCLETLINSLENHIQSTYSVIPQSLDNNSFELHTNEQKQQFGHASWNIALILSKQVKQNPRLIAENILSHCSHYSGIEKIEIAGPGFLNFFFSTPFFSELAQEIFDKKELFFKPSLPTHYRYSLEFVSANPTGPLHLGHGRNAIIGDVLARILSFIGHSVTTEFYINDGGSQIEKLGNSLKIRCLQAQGVNIEMPEDGYHGDYLNHLAQEFLNHYGPAIVNEPASLFASWAQEKLLEHIKETLIEYGITFDVWFSEKQLRASKAIEAALDQLTKKELTYTHENALWFKSTLFGDDKDRVIQKASGEYTYLAPDIAYLCNKLERGFNKVIMILGQDHHSYALRMQALMKAFDKNPDDLEIILYQLVTLQEDSIPVRMSKRSGKTIGLQEIIDTVGKDVARFFYLNRKADAHLEFDIAKALKKSEENPVYYIQYAYVRAHSILEKSQTEPLFNNINSSDLAIENPAEKTVLLKIIELKNILKVINHNHQTHLLTYYAYELAQAFHHYYRFQRVIEIAYPKQTRHRLALIELIKDTLALVLDLLGLQAPTSM